MKDLFPLFNKIIFKNYDESKLFKRVSLLNIHFENNIRPNDVLRI